MSIETISLRKVLQLMMADPSLQTRLLRTNIRDFLKRQESGPGEGGDFHTCFWADAKGHAAGEVNLRDSTVARIATHRGRRRLYPLLTEGFLTWWEERRRRRNEPFVIERRPIRGRFVLDGLGIVKVENNLAFAIGDDGYRVVYPYFCEEPDLSNNAARLGLWVMQQALPDYRLEDFRVLDVLRSTSFSIAEAPLNGGEEAEFKARYQQLLDRWSELRLLYR